jgi:hypothetical protein
MNQAKMKNICVLITGVVRPDTDRVFKNIKNTIETVGAVNCDVYILTYRSPEAEELEKQLNRSSLDVSFYLIDPITAAQGGQSGNNYRMFKSIELLISHVDNFLDYKVVLRHRIDCELLEIEIPEEIKQDTYYAPSLEWGTFDNIALCSPQVAMKMFSTEGVNFNVINPHQVIDNTLSRKKISLAPFNFKKQLYQSGADIVLGTPQWSKRDRTFEYKDEWISIE